jgi:hypothetical protein
VANVPDEAWAEVARTTRDALALLGRPVGPRCLPGEPDHCGGSFADHAAAQLAALEAVIEHQLWHLRPPDSMIAHIRQHERAELEKGCPDHA